MDACATGIFFADPIVCGTMHRDLRDPWFRDIEDRAEYREVGLVSPEQVAFPVSWFNQHEVS
jgi:hypothetical protein